MGTGILQRTGGKGTGILQRRNRNWNSAEEVRERCCAGCWTRQAEVPHPKGIQTSWKRGRRTRVHHSCFIPVAFQEWEMPQAFPRRPFVLPSLLPAPKLGLNPLPAQGTLPAATITFLPIPGMMGMLQGCWGLTGIGSSPFPAGFWQGRGNVSPC